MVCLTEYFAIFFIKKDVIYGTNIFIICVPGKMGKRM